MALEEFYLVLEGTASMRVGEEHHELRVGDSVLAPAGVEHDLRNTGDGTLRVLVVWGEEGHKDFSAFGSVAKARAGAKPASNKCLARGAGSDRNAGSMRASH